MNLVGKIGVGFLGRWQGASDTAAVSWGVLAMSLRARHWRRTVRRLLVRQLVFTGVDALGLTLIVAVLAGMSVVAQAQFWLGRLGQSAMVGPLLVAVLIREAAPLLVNFLVIGRSGTAIATELAGMRARHEVLTLDAQGVDPTEYLVIPRVLGVVASVFCLSTVFVAASLGSGYLLGLALGVMPADPLLFAEDVFRAVDPRDVLNYFAKTLIPGITTGTICCVEGLRTGGSVTDIPRAATRAVVRSIAALLVVSAVVSVLTLM